jgi:PAS domain S-box-containing protein
MTELRHVVEIAQALVGRMGPDGHAVIATRAREHERDGDAEGAAFWAKVARAMNSLGSGAGRPPARRNAPAPPHLPEPAFRQTFDQAPHPYLLLKPELVIADANAAYLAATLTRKGDIVGCGLFEVFPDNPDLDEADGVVNLGRSLETVLATQAPHRMARQRYDVRNRDGAFEERWWEPLNAPIFDIDGRLSLILHHVRDVTAEVRAGAETDQTGVGAADVPSS